MSEADPTSTRYELHEEIGRGGFGSVIRATDKRLGRPVAIKRLHLRPDDEVWERFQREAQVLAQLDHPHILRLYDFGVADGQPFFVTELLEGESLDASTPEDPLQAMLEVAEGLAALHGRGLIHRDVKPANILRTRQGRTVLLDLGLVAGEGMEVLTATGMVVGTPAYMAPEILRGQRAAPASDWYAWGMTLEKLLEKAGSSRGRALAVECQAVDPEARPGIEEIRKRAAPGGGDRSGKNMPVRVTETLSGVAPAPGVTGEVTAAVASPRRAAAPVAIAVGVALAAWLAWPAPQPAAPASPEPPRAPEVGPLGPDLARGLSEELDAALQLDLEVPVGPGRTRTLAFMDAASLWGVGALDHLPRHREVLEWFARGGDPRMLTEAEREALRGHDDALVDLRLPPPFGPLLETEPTLPSEAPPPEAELHDRFRRLPLERLSPVAKAWTDLALWRYRQAAAEHVRVVEASAHFAGNNESANLFAEHPEDPGAVNVIRLRGSTRGRDTLRDMVGAGEAALRGYLVAARRALDHVEPEQAEAFASGYSWLFRVRSLLFTSSMITASRDRLFGTPAESVAGLLFEVRVLWTLRIHRDRCLVPHGPLLDDAIAAWQRAAEATQGLDPKLHSEQVYGWLNRLDVAGAEELPEVWGRYRGKLVGLPSYHFEALDEIASRRDLPPIR
jgi:hypothetical protein